MDQKDMEQKVLNILFERINQLEDEVLGLKFQVHSAQMVYDQMKIENVELKAKLERFNRKYKELEEFAKGLEAGADALRKGNDSLKDQNSVLRAKLDKAVPDRRYELLQKSHRVLEATIDAYSEYIKDGRDLCQLCRKSWNYLDNKECQVCASHNPFHMLKMNTVVRPNFEFNYEVIAND